MSRHSSSKAATRAAWSRLQTCEVTSEAITAHTIDPGRTRMPPKSWSTGRVLRGRSLLEVVPSEGDDDRLRGDPSHLVGAHVPRLADHSGRHDQPREDVLLGVASDLRDPADLLAVRVEHAPSRLDHEP